MKSNADLAIVVGGYNSSNTTHLVELLEESYPTYINNTEHDILNRNEISHFDIHKKVVKKSTDFIPSHEVVDIVLTSGASCPDAVVDRVLHKLLDYFNETKTVKEVLSNIEVKN